MSTIPEMFLAADNWSPRFENTFFTVKLESFELLQSDPETITSSVLSKGKGNFPAYFYKIDVLCGHERQSVLRRYSQFDWLASVVRADAEMPPKTWICQMQNDSFAQNRLEQLREFLDELLATPGVAKEPAVIAFLALDSFGKDDKR